MIKMLKTWFNFSAKQEMNVSAKEVKTVDTNFNILYNEQH